jgi:pSer/pThr/pTyr-binding forkhead associated (FHA) protein
MPRIEVVDPNGQRQIKLNDPVITFGRLGSSTIQLRDPACSRTHFEIRERDGRFWVKDLGSRNQTLLNGKPVKGEMSLKTEDVIRAGRSQVIFEPADASRLAPPVKKPLPPKGKAATGAGQPAKPAPASAAMPKDLSEEPTRLAPATMLPLKEFAAKSSKAKARGAAPPAAKAPASPPARKGGPSAPPKGIPSFNARVAGPGSDSPPVLRAVQKKPPKKD